MSIVHGLYARTLGFILAPNDFPQQQWMKSPTPCHKKKNKWDNRQLKGKQVQDRKKSMIEMARVFFSPRKQQEFLLCKRVASFSKRRLLQTRQHFTGLDEGSANSKTSDLQNTCWERLAEGIPESTISRGSQFNKMKVQSVTGI